MPILRNFRLIPAFTLQGPGKQKQQLDAGSAEATAELGLLGNTPGLRAEVASWGMGLQASSLVSAGASGSSG